MAFTNPEIVARFNELIADGRQLDDDQRRSNHVVRDPVALTKWMTSSLNLLDKLAVSTNRFVREFEKHSTIQNKFINVGTALGVLLSARDEYERGFAIDYQLGLTATVFGDLMTQADYLLERTYKQAAAVLIGAALEEGLKARARAMSLEVGPRETLDPLIDKLRGAGVLDAFEADHLKAVAKLRNAAAHGSGFTYDQEQVVKAASDVRTTLGRLLSRGA